MPPQSSGIFTWRVKMIDGMAGVGKKIGHTLCFNMAERGREEYDNEANFSSSTSNSEVNKRPITNFIRCKNEFVSKYLTELAVGEVVALQGSIMVAAKENWAAMTPKQKAPYIKSTKEDFKNYKKNTQVDSGTCQIFQTRCSPARFVKVVKGLSVEKRKFIKDIGFGSLLDLKCKNLRDSLCKWLVTHFDHVTCCLKISQENVIPITAKDVKSILGIPFGSKENVSHGILSNSSWVKDGGFDKIGGLQLSKLEGNLQKADINEEDFKRSFVLFTCACLLTPNSKNEASKYLLAAVNYVSAIPFYNWAKYVLECLQQAVKEYKSTGGRSYVNDCLLFLMLFYLHLVDVNGPRPVHQSSCLSDWTNKLIGKRLKFEHLECGGFGHGWLKTVELNYVMMQKLNPL